MPGNVNPAASHIILQNSSRELFNIYSGDMRPLRTAGAVGEINFDLSVFSLKLFPEKTSHIANTYRKVKRRR